MLRFFRSQLHRIRVDDQPSEMRRDRLRHSGLHATAEAIAKELLHRAIECEAIVGIGKAMAFIRRYDVFDFDPAIAQRGHELIRLDPCHARIVCALNDEEWNANAVNPAEW